MLSVIDLFVGMMRLLTRDEQLAVIVKLFESDESLAIAGREKLADVDRVMSREPN
jgi:hypothetical protein